MFVCTCAGLLKSRTSPAPAMSTLTWSCGAASMLPLPAMWTSRRFIWGARFGTRGTHASRLADHQYNACQLIVY